MLFSLVNEIMKYPFLKRAFLVAGILISICVAILGVNLVLKRYSMIGDGLSHVGFFAFKKKMNKYKYKIRLHHGMCIAFFQGKGYSNKFTAHMDKIIHKLENNPIIYISTQTDIICCKCPNNKQGLCEMQSKVIEYDRQVLKYCSLFEGMIIPYADLKKAIYENILIPDKRKEICGNCQWNKLCYFNAKQ